MKVKKNVPPKSLKPHPLNEKIYGNEIDHEVLESIRTTGIITPLTVAALGVIVSGHQRWLAAIELDLNEMPIIHDQDLKDEKQIQRQVIESNRQRVKTPEQIGNEIAAIQEIEAKAACGPMSKISKSTQSAQPTSGERTVRSPVTDEAKQEGSVKPPLAKAASVVGVSIDDAKRAKVVAEEIKKAESNGDTERAADIRSEKTVGAAHRKATNGKPKKAAGKPPSEHESLRKLIGEISRKCDDLTKRLSVMGFSGFGIGVVLEELQTAKDWLSDQQ